MASKDPRQMTTGQVADEARRAGIEGVEKMNKQQLMQALQQKPQKAQRPQKAPKPQKAESTLPGRGGGKGDTPPPQGSRPQDWKNIPGNQS